ncbi:MAG: hypothetical protein ACI828_000715 [Flavobacteriales bacterium]|jgi:hypothetical protein
MKKDNIDQLFNRLGGNFDTSSPSADHKAKFLEKLQTPQEETSEVKVIKLQWWKPLLIAASVLLMAGMLFTNISTIEAKDLADISPEMQETQNFFTRTIERELFEIKKQNTPATEKLVSDAMSRMEKLETNYNKLQVDLKESGEDKRVIYAMIDNFQNRIDLLQQVLEHMDAIKNLNELQPAVL